jgi:hypothetical protein
MARASAGQGGTVERTNGKLCNSDGLTAEPKGQLRVYGVARAFALRLDACTLCLARGATALLFITLLLSAGKSRFAMVVAEL